MSTGTVGVIGAGVMGAGVAQCAAEAGYQVVLVDLAERALTRAREEIRRGVREQVLVRRRRLDVGDVLGRITTTTDVAALATAEFVIENVTERWETKQPVYEQLDRVCAAETIVAANTSVISITKLGSLMARPERVIGIHFMNPVPLKATVEMIRGHHTAPGTIERTARFLDSLGKRFVLVNDATGFVSNRVLMLTINEAVFLVHEGVAAAEEVDRVFRDCFGHPMGPLETADLIGLDTILLSIEGLVAGFGDSKYRPCPLLRRMVDAGCHGRKSGRGFYCYQAA